MVTVFVDYLVFNVNEVGIPNFQIFREMEKENESPGIYRHQDCVESQYDQVPCQKKISNKAVVLESF